MSMMKADVTAENKPACSPTYMRHGDRGVCGKVPTNINVLFKSSLHLLKKSRSRSSATRWNFL